MIHHLSLEFLLKRCPNGGTVVFWRSLIITLMIYALAVGLKERVSPGATWQPDLEAAREVVAETIPWFGAIFAGVYVALYTRFASQWNYLASLYNQMMAMSVQCPPEGTTSSDNLVLWQAGFIEDADDLHLVTKPMFASVVSNLLQQQAVRDAITEYSPGGARRLGELETKVKAALDKANSRRGLGAELVATVPQAPAHDAQKTLSARSAQLHT